MIKIFGCGVSGLACGIELMKAGIKHSLTGIPDFYRKAYECQGMGILRGRDLLAPGGDAAKFLWHEAAAENKQPAGIIQRQGGGVPLSG